MCIIIINTHIKSSIIIIRIHCTSQADLPLYEVVLWGELHLFKVSTELRHGLVKEDAEGVKVRSHQSVVDSKESQVGGAVEKVGQTDESISCFHVEQEDSCQK